MMVTKCFSILLGLVFVESKSGEVYSSKNCRENVTEARIRLISSKRIEEKVFLYAMVMMAYLLLHTRVGRQTLRN